MIDLHSHVLFNIDDGAETIEDSLRILRRAEKIGVSKMAVTPHFTIGENVEEFLLKRKCRIEQLECAARAEGIEIELIPGAEVYITDELFNESELEKLAIGKSRVILAEFKYHGLKSGEMIEYIEEIFSSGLGVLVAHPERYSYLRKDALLLDKLLEKGVLLQVNAISLFEDSEDGEFARMLVKSGLAFTIGSDIHHASSKRLDAMEKLNESGKWDRLLKENPGKIINARGMN